MNKRNITVGIITMHRVLNFGSVLQTYALQQTVSNLGYSSEIIDYKFPNSEHFMYLEKSDEQAIILPLKSRIIDAIKTVCFQTIRRRYTSWKVFTIYK